MNLRYALLAIGAAAFAVIVTGGLHEARVAPNLDGAQILVWVASVIAVLLAIGIGCHHAGETGAPDKSVLIGVLAGGFAFVLSWAPLVVLFVLHPPS